MQIQTQMGPKSLNVHKTAKDGHTRAAWYDYLTICGLVKMLRFVHRPPGPGSKNMEGAA